MKVQEIMHDKVETVTTRDTVRDAARKLSDRDIGMLPVMGADSKIVGTLTDRDIVINAIAQGKVSEKTKVEEVMSSDVVTCEPDASLEEAAKLMQSHRIRRLVVARNGAPVGVVSIGDIANRIEDQVLVSKTLAEVS